MKIESERDIIFNFGYIDYKEVKKKKQDTSLAALSSQTYDTFWC